MRKIVEVLALSVEKNGEVPLTNRHLLNIIKMAIRWEDEENEKQSAEYDLSNI